MNAPSLYAAIDLGSNSFHLVVMRSDGAHLQSIECKRELVRLAAGVDNDTGRLTKEARNRALRCLNHFRDALQQIPAANITAVGTSAFRRLVGDVRFLHQAETALGNRSGFSAVKTKRVIFIAACLRVAMTAPGVLCSILAAAAPN